MSARIDRSGQYFERLLVLRHIWSIGWVVCLCDCGKIWVGDQISVVHKRTKSCGCLNSELTINRSQKHGDAIRKQITVEYRAWLDMKTRCYNPKYIQWEDYGGRGIQVCERWLDSFENFLVDMGRKPGPEYSIDRFPDNDGDYCPENCRWATQTQQISNRRKGVTE